MKHIYNLILTLSFCMLCVCTIQANEKLTTNNTVVAVSLQKVDSLQTQEKQVQLIAELTKRQEAFETKYYILVGCILFLVLLFGLLCFLNKRGDKRLEKIVTLLENHKSEQPTNEEVSERYQIDIDDTIVNEILENLKAFEAEKGFLISKITLHAFAKKMQTNTKYLSKVINTYKLKSFRNYINDLRIQYSIETLETDLNFRKYTISTMAKEAGFSTRESFTKAFRKRTGETVSSFVEQLR